MKFKQVGVGERFSYQDKIYTKLGPFQAKADDDKNPRLITQAAVVQPVNEQGEVLAVSSSVGEKLALRKAINSYHKACLEVLAESESISLEKQQQLERLNKKMLKFAT